MTRSIQVSLLAIGMALVLVFLAPHADLNAAPPTKVMVVNPFDNPALTRDVDEAAKIPFQKFVTLEIAAGSWDDTETIDLGPDVPGNYRMVIEFVSLQGRIPHDQVPSIAIHTNNGLPNYIAPVMLGPVDEFTHFQGSQASRIYNSAKSFQVNLHRFAHEASGTVRAYVAINGYLVPVPAP